MDGIDSATCIDPNFPHRRVPVNVPVSGMLELLWKCSVGDGHTGQLHFFDHGNAYAVLD